MDWANPLMGFGLIFRFLVGAIFVRKLTQEAMIQGFNVYKRYTAIGVEISPLLITYENLTYFFLTLIITLMTT